MIFFSEGIGGGFGHPGHPLATLMNAGYEWNMHTVRPAFVVGPTVG